MKIHVFTIVWNEKVMLPFFLRHYETFADRIFVIDNGSTDKTAEIAKAHDKVTLLNFDCVYKFDNDSFEYDFNKFFTDSSKKYSRGVADWVMCVDADEFIYHPDMKNHLDLERKKGVRIIKPTAYQMVSKKNPETTGQIYEECFLGVRSRGYDKPVIFDPKLDMVFGVGRHKLISPGGVKQTRAKLSLLHYRYISRDYFIERSNITWERKNFTQEFKNYRMARGLKFYDDAINSDLVKVI